MIYWRIPCENLRPLVGRICESYSWQLSLAYAATDREMYTTAKMNARTHTHTHTHTSSRRRVTFIGGCLDLASLVPLRNTPPKVQNDVAMDRKMFIKIRIFDSIPATSASFLALWVQPTLFQTKHVNLGYHWHEMNQHGSLRVSRNSMSGRMFVCSVFQRHKLAQN
jgi:hypothetical protein